MITILKKIVIFDCCQEKAECLNVLRNLIQFIGMAFCNLLYNNSHIIINPKIILK